MTIYNCRELWADYALRKLRETEKAATESGVSDRLHLWPDKALGTKEVVKRQSDPDAYVA